MTQSQRHRLLLDYLETHLEISVEEAVAMFSASPATIRRDFNQLHDEGKAIKTWGGLMRNESTGHAVSTMLPLSYRQESHLQEKKRIAEAASKLITDGQVIFIDGGTTTLQMAPFIANKRIRVITNSIIVAHEIDRSKTSKQGAEVFVTGGVLYPDSGLLVGPQTNNLLTQYHADMAFISAGSVDAQGIYNSNQWVVESEQVMIQQSSETILLVDHSKFGKKHMCKLSDFEPIQHIISDKGATNWENKIPAGHLNWTFA